MRFGAQPVRIANDRKRRNGPAVRRMPSLDNDLARNTRGLTHGERERP
jgi:hypothetical protein